MVEKGILRNGSVNAIEAFLKELATTRKGVEGKQKEWPFEIGIYILSLHVQRLRTIEKVLTQRVEQITKQLAEQALAHNEGQDGAPNRNVQEEIRHDNEVVDGGTQQVHIG
jgi:hypothetical protein